MKKFSRVYRCRFVAVVIFVFLASGGSAQDSFTLHRDAATNAETIEQLTLRNQEVLITNQRLRNEVTKYVEQLRQAKDRSRWISLLVGSGIFVLGLLSGAYIVSKFRSRQKWS